MYNKRLADETVLNINTATAQETFIQKIARVMAQGEAIDDGAEIVFQNPEDGIAFEFNPRSDRWDFALEAQDQLNRDKIAAGKGLGGDVKGEGSEGGQAPPDTKGV